MLPAKNLSEILRYARGLTRTASSPALSFRVRYSHTVTAKSSYIAASTEKDPYQYQVGFGNRFVSEALWVLCRARLTRLGLTQRHMMQAWGTPSGAEYPAEGQIWAVH